MRTSYLNQIYFNKLTTKWITNMVKRKGLSSNCLNNLEVIWSQRVNKNTAKEYRAPQIIKFNSNPKQIILSPRQRLQWIIPRTYSNSFRKPHVTNKLFRNDTKSCGPGTELKQKLFNSLVIKWRGTWKSSSKMSRYFKGLCILRGILWSILPRQRLLFRMIVICLIEPCTLYRPQRWILGTRKAPKERIKFWRTPNSSRSETSRTAICPKLLLANLSCLKTGSTHSTCRPIAGFSYSVPSLSTRETCGWPDSATS